MLTRLSGAALLVVSLYLATFLMLQESQPQAIEPTPDDPRERFIETCIDVEEIPARFCNDQARRLGDPNLRAKYWAALDRACSHIELDGTETNMRARLTCEGVEIINACELPAEGLAAFGIEEKCP
jgi:hypothetical protein